MAKTDTLFDPFTTEDVAVWEGWDVDDVTVVSDQLTVDYLNSGPFLQTVIDYDLTDSSVFVEVYHVPSDSDETYFAFGDAGSPVFGGDQIIMVVNTTTLFLRELVAGVADDATVAYDDATMRWWRIRHAGTAVFWETSPDGLDWAVQRTKTEGFTPSAGRVKLGGFNPVGDQVESPARFDNVNGGTPAATTGVFTLTFPPVTLALAGEATVFGTLDVLFPALTALFRGGGVGAPIIVGAVTGPAVAPLSVEGPARPPDPAAVGPGVPRVATGPAVSRDVDGIGV